MLQEETRVGGVWGMDSTGAITSVEAMAEVFRFYPKTVRNS